MRVVAALFQHHDPLGRIDPCRFGQQHADVFLMAKHPTNWRCDIARRQGRRGDLIQQRLKQMVVVPIEERDADRRAVQRAGRIEPAKAAADDDDMWKIRHVGDNT